MKRISIAFVLILGLTSAQSAAPRTVVVSALGDGSKQTSAVHVLRYATNKEEALVRVGDRFEAGDELTAVANVTIELTCPEGSAVKFSGKFRAFISAPKDKLQDCAINLLAGTGRHHHKSSDVDRIRRKNRGIQGNRLHDPCRSRRHGQHIVMRGSRRRSRSARPVGRPVSTERRFEEGLVSSKRQRAGPDRGRHQRKFGAVRPHGCSQGKDGWSQNYADHGRRTRNFVPSRVSGAVGLRGQSRTRREANQSQDHLGSPLSTRSRGEAHAVHR